MISDTAIKLIVVGALLIAAALGFRSWLNDRDTRRDNEITQQANERTEEAAGKIGEAAQGHIDNAGARDAGIAGSQQRFQDEYKKIRTDPAVRDALDTPVPDSLRQLARQRREERERLECGEAGCREDGSKADANTSGWFFQNGGSGDAGKRLPAWLEP